MVHAPLLRRASARHTRSRPVCALADGGGHVVNDGRLGRRAFLAAAAAAAMVPGAAEAISGMQDFPRREPLENTYYFMRAGESVSYANNQVLTNPVLKTSVETHGLTPRGVQQVLRAAQVLESDGQGPMTWLWASQCQSCQETAELLAYQLNIRREQMVPEFAYLDARGVGAFEGQDLRTVRAALDAIDREDPERRMPPNDDGTPNDSVADVFVRVRQLLSKLETQYLGESIVVIAPDSDLLSILECALMDEPLSQHRKFAFKPGDVRRVSSVVVSADGTPIGA